MFGIIRRFQVSKAWLCHKMSFQFSRTVICPLVSNIRDLLWKAEWNIHSWVFKSDLCVHHMYDQCVLHWVSPALPWQHQWYLDLLLIVFVKLNQNDHKYWDGNAIYTSVATAVPRCVLSSSSSSHVVPGAALHSLAPDTDSVTLSWQPWLGKATKVWTLQLKPRREKGWGWESINHNQSISPICDLWVFQNMWLCH